jgi:hypothetical protein
MSTQSSLLGKRPAELAPERGTTIAVGSDSERVYLDRPDEPIGPHLLPDL